MYVQVYACILGLILGLLLIIDVNLSSLICVHLALGTGGTSKGTAAAQYATTRICCQNWGTCVAQFQPVLSP